MFQCLDFDRPQNGGVLNILKSLTSTNYHHCLWYIVCVKYPYPSAFTFLCFRPFLIVLQKKESLMFFLQEKNTF